MGGGWRLSYLCLHIQLSSPSSPRLFPFATIITIISSSGRISSIAIAIVAIIVVIVIIVVRSKWHLAVYVVEFQSQPMPFADLQLGVRGR